MPPPARDRGDATARFGALVRRPEADIDLAAAALLVAEAMDPATDTEACLRTLDQFAEGIRDLVGLCRRLFVDLQFEGDRRGYQRPINSLLPSVMARRRGIPISLSIIALEVGKRCGVPLQPIGMPGHFLVREPQTGLYIDAFGACVLEESDCEAVFRAATGAGPEVPFGPEALAATAPRAVLRRLVNNLVSACQVEAEAPATERALRLRLAMPGASPADSLGLAQAMAAQGRAREAALELETRARAQPEAASALLAGARAILSQLN